MLTPHADDVFREAKAFGVADRIQMIQDASIDEVPNINVTVGLRSS